MDTNTNDPTSAPPASPRRARRWALVAVVVIVSLLLVAELVARFYLGLGDPPLSVADPQVEYMFKPSQEVRRFGNRIHYNAYSMRSDDFPRQKSDPRELRVMVIGDSVINGGAQTDQAQIATSILQKELAERIGRPVVVGNISAGSWGPPNMLAYVKKFGLFDADLVVIVLSSHDYADVPTEPFVPVVGVQPSYPDRKPVLALQELLIRYLLPRVGFGSSADASMPVEREPEQKEIDRGLSAINEMIQIARSNEARVLVALYPERRELDGPALPGHAMIRDAARAAGAEVVDLTPALRQSAQAGNDPHRDVIHPNATGQRVMADVLLDEVSVPPTTSSSPPG